MESKGEFLLQLLQGGGGGGNARSSSSGGVGRKLPGPSSEEEDFEGSPGWQQHRDPAVAALGPSHSFLAGEPLVQPIHLFGATPQFGAGVWTPPLPPPQQQGQHQHHHQHRQQQQQNQFFGFGAGGPHPLHGNRFPPYPPPPSAQLAEHWPPEPWGQQVKVSVPQQQFLGNGDELLQLLLGGSSQNVQPVHVLNPQGGPEEGIPVDHVLLPRAQVHGPIGPPSKRSDSVDPAPPAGGDLLGRFWALPNGAPGGLDASKPTEFSKSKVSKGKVSKPPGFFRERDGGPVEPAFGASNVKALNHFSSGAAGPLAWERFRDGPPADVKRESNIGRPSEDRGNYQMQPIASRFGGVARNREEAHSNSSGLAGDDRTSVPSADGSETREFGRMGTRGSGRRGGGAGRAEMGRRSSPGQWVAVNEKRRDRDSEREGSTSYLLVEPDGSASADGSASGSSFASPQSGKATATSSGKDESPNGSSGGKSKEDMKRRRGQAQEWRMKQASPPHSKSPTYPGSQGASLPFQQAGNSEGILPLASQVDRPGLPSNTVRPSMPGSATDESKQQLQYQLDEGVGTGGRERAGRYLFENGRLTWEDGLGGEEEEDLMRDLSISGYTKLEEDTHHFPTAPPVTQNVTRVPVLTREESELEEKPGNLRESREVRRNQQRLNVPTTLIKGDLQRLDFETFTPQLLAIYKSLIPSQEEVQRQRKFLTQLDRLVSRDWGGAKLFLFGSCANDFGVRNSDIDICLSVDDEHSSKAELVTKMAAILRSDNMQNVQALTHARVPIVKFSDPDTGINCDICVNNMLAVVNSKLLHDYSQVDPRLRQLAFLVKHWAKRRQVNETYRGTLSSYAYVLMCIHFLQQRRPAVLPCLQSMQPTYEVTVGTIRCSYFDKVNSLKNFGARNNESVAELLTYFFEYWASSHDYNRWVISVRTGGYLSKDEKDWTRRIGNERHLLCIEDPFEITHDLGRVVDRHSIRVLRDEFKRAARILRQDSNPATTLFEPFIREKV